MRILFFVVMCPQVRVARCRAGCKGVLVVMFFGRDQRLATREVPANLTGHENDSARAARLRAAVRQRRISANGSSYMETVRPPVKRPGWLTLAYGLTIFASAFLLLQVQPLITKMILPWFGGVAAVWTVCLVFFQVMLLGGYFYAHVLSAKFEARTQGRIHVGLLAVSLLALPILPKNSFKPVGADAPAWHILVLLAVTVGLPYFVLSSTSPLLQSWYARARSDAAPYRFYALSNVGSMLALLSYPVLVEPLVATTRQGRGWSVAYAALAVLSAFVSLWMIPGDDAATNVSPYAAAPVRPGWKRQALWVALAACGSALLLAVTNHISQNIASVPFLWVIPLSLYLFSFILCFDTAGWYRRHFFLRLLGVALGAMAYGLDPSFAILPMKVLIPVYCLGLWICCMFCHGELARLKPDPAHLTSFYLMVSLGGAIGAVFVALMAPAIFSGYYELPCALGMCAVLVVVVQFRDPSRIFQGKMWRPTRPVLVGLVIALLASLAVSVREVKREARRSVRNFYGVLRVIDHEGASFDKTSDPNAPEAIAASGRGTSARMPGHMPMYLSPYQTSYRRLMNGTIDHGLQFLSQELRRRPTSYYSEKSGIGVALKTIQGRGALRIGVVGLGAGTLAAYGRAGDQYTFYEINPLDVKVAEEEFTFLRDSEAKIDIAAGDARLALERAAPQRYDALVVDAFSSDSIPVHLLTREAFELYFRQLKPDGVLALHISNQYLNLQPVVEGAAAELGKEAVIVNNGDDHPRGIYSAAWILMGSPEGFYGKREMEEAGAILLPTGRERSWTDSYSSVLRVIK